jgi:hypothetical protein
MTFERKIVVGLEEIKTIIFECNQCGTRAVIKPEDAGVPPDRCPRNHGWNWNVISEHREIGPPSVSWLISLKRLGDPMLVQSDGFRILLEFEAPRESR